MITEKLPSLAKGWQWRKFGDCVQFINGRAYSQHELLDSGTPVLRIQNLNGGDRWYYSNLKLPDEKYCEAGDLLYAWSASFGPYRFNGPKSIFHYHIWRVVPGSEIDKDFVFYLLDEITAKVKSAARGVAMLHMTKGGIEAWPIPLPPLAEQKRIAAILDAADALRAKRREALAQLDALLQSTFLTLFGDCDRPPVSLGKPTFGKSANFVPLSTVATMATGHTPDRGKSKYWNGNIPWISLTEIRDFNGRIATETRENVSEEGIKNSSSVKLPKGTVCFSRTASVGFVTVMGREMSTSQDFVNWVCGLLLNPIYLMWCLISSRDYLLSKSAGSIHKTIYHRHTERFQIYLPPLPLQQKFAAIVESIERQKAAQRAHLAELDALFAALQHRAFRGEL
jgi:type I restriction enzyme S subunit